MTKVLKRMNVEIEREKIFFKSLRKFFRINKRVFLDWKG